VSEYQIQPQDYFSSVQSLDGLAVEDAAQSLALITDALGKQASANGTKAADLIAINAGAALYVAGCATDLQQGVEMALDAIGSGIARAKINDLATFTQVQQDG
jgi:anthranilate phosphoribosyltransferase